MKNKAQVLIIFLWILAFFVILVVTMANRAIMTLKYARAHKDKQVALYLARAGVNTAVYELEKDANAFDALNEPWADSEDKFKQISVTQSDSEYAQVGYLDKKSGEEVFGVKDEERKININTASEQLLVVLFEKCAISDPEAIAKNVLIWRQEDSVDENGVYEALGYGPKHNKLSNTEELMLVAGISAQDYLKVKDFVTVYTDGKININTVSDEVLLMLTSSIARELSVSQEAAANLTTWIIGARNSAAGVFLDKGSIPVPVGDDERNILNALTADMVFSSQKFLIEVKGKTGKIENKIIVVYDRDPESRKFLYWHES